jgi:hypothetical protein
MGGRATGTNTGLACAVRSRPDIKPLKARIKASIRQRPFSAQPGDVLLFGDAEALLTAVMQGVS